MRSGAKTALSQTPMNAANQRATSVPAQKYYTVLSEEEPPPFGFGSQAPARPEVKYPDIPGPGRYEPRPCAMHFESIRGHGNGFTSKTKRRIKWGEQTKTPAPNSYFPSIVDKKPKITIGNITFGRRCLAYPDERTASEAPGPSDYYIEEKKKRAPSSVFKSRTERSIWGTSEKKKPRYDGRTLVIPFGM